MKPKLVLLFLFLLGALVIVAVDSAEHAGSDGWIHVPPSPESPAWKERLKAIHPSDDLKRILTPLQRHTFSESDAATLATFYLDFADVIRGDRLQVLKTNLQFRDAHRNACELMFVESGIERTYPGIVDEVDAVLSEAIGCKRTPAGDGWEVVEITEATRVRLADALQGVAWRLGTLGGTP